MTGPEYYEFVSDLAAGLAKSITAFRPVEWEDALWATFCITRELEDHGMMSPDLYSQAAWFSQTLLIVDSEMMPQGKNQGLR